MKQELLFNKKEEEYVVGITDFSPDPTGNGDTGNIVFDEYGNIYYSGSKSTTVEKFDGSTWSTVYSNASRIQQIAYYNSRLYIADADIGLIEVNLNDYSDNILTSGDGRSVILINNKVYGGFNNGDIYSYDQQNLVLEKQIVDRALFEGNRFLGKALPLVCQAYTAQKIYIFDGTSWSNFDISAEFPEFAKSVVYHNDYIYAGMRYGTKVYKYDLDGNVIDSYVFDPNTDHVQYMLVLDANVIGIGNNGRIKQYLDGSFQEITQEYSFSWHGSAEAFIYDSTLYIADATGDMLTLKKDTLL